MALQEMDLTIQHHSGKHNLNVDALSRFPQAHPATEEIPSEGVVASITAGDRDLAMQQREDDELKVIMTYLEKGVLPEAGQTAKRVALTQSQYVVKDGVLYRVASDSTLRVIPPMPMCESLFREAHCGRFGTHLGDSKVHSELNKHYWWEGMRSDITRWSRACLVSATHNPGRGPRPPFRRYPCQAHSTASVLMLFNFQNLTTETSRLLSSWTI